LLKGCWLLLFPTLKVGLNFGPTNYLYNMSEKGKNGLLFMKKSNGVYSV
jgi:hypothetical protein